MLSDLPGDVLFVIVSRYLSGRDARSIMQCCSSLSRLCSSALACSYTNTLVAAYGPYRFARYRPDRVPARARAAVALALARSYWADRTDGLSLGYCSRHGLWEIWRQIMDQGATYSQSRPDLERICTGQVSWRLMGNSADMFQQLLGNDDLADPDWHKAMADLIRCRFQWGSSSIFYGADLEHGSDLQRQDRHDLLQFVLEHGADPSSQPNTSDLAPLLALSSSTRSGRSHGPIQGLLLLHGSDPNQICSSNGMTPLQIASARSHIDIVHDLIRAGADPHHTGLCSGLTPLHHVANCLRPQSRRAVQILVENGAQLNPVDDDGLTPMHYAATRDNDVFVEALCELGYDLHHESASGSNPWPPAFFAVLNRSDRVLRLILGRGHAPGRTGPHGKTLLHAAVECQNIGACHILLSAGADPNQADHYGMTPLGSALYRNYTEGAHLLLDHGAQVHIDILHTAARLASADLMQALVRSCRDPDMADSMGKTALMHAARFANHGSVQALLQAGVNIDRADRSGFTALFYARAYGNHEVETLLLQAGATKERLRRLKLFCSGSSLDQTRSVVY